MQQKLKDKELRPRAVI